MVTVKRTATPGSAVRLPSDRHTAAVPTLTWDQIPALSTSSGPPRPMGLPSTLGFPQISWMLTEHLLSTASLPRTKNPPSPLTQHCVLISLPIKQCYLYFLVTFSSWFLSYLWWLTTVHPTMLFSNANGSIPFPSPLLCTTQAQKQRGQALRGRFPFLFSSNLFLTSWHYFVWSTYWLK